MKAARLDTAVVVYPRPAVAWACWRAGISRRIGTAHRWYSWGFNDRVPVRRKSSDRHELELNFELVRPLGVTFQGEEPRVVFSEEDRRAVAPLLAGLKGRKVASSGFPGISR